MIFKTFFLPFLSLQSFNNPQTSDKGNTTLEVTIQINMLYKLVTAFHSTKFRIKKLFDKIDYLSIPRV